MSIFGRAAVFAVAVMMVLGLAFTASAQDEKKGAQVRGDVQAFFGMLTKSGDDNTKYPCYTSAATGTTPNFTCSDANINGSELASGFESNIYFSGGSGNLQVDSRIRFRGTDRNVSAPSEIATNDPLSGNTCCSAARFFLKWQPTEGLDIWAGRLNGFKHDAAYSDIDSGQQPVRVQGDVLRGTSQNGIDINYGMGAINVGLAIITNCDPACDGGVATLSTGTANQTYIVETYNQQTLVPHIQFKSGPLKAKFQYNMASGNVFVAERIDSSSGVPGRKIADKSVSSTAYVFGLDYAMGFGRVSFDYYSYDEGGIKFDGAGAADTTPIAAVDNKNFTRTTTGIALRTKMGVEAMYWSDVGKQDTNQVDETVLQVQFMMKAGQGVTGPVFATFDQKYNQGGPKFTNQTIGWVWKSSL